MKKTAILASASLMAMTAAQAVTMAELDADADGLASFAEVLEVMPDMTVETFDVVDVNQDGMIDLDELTAAQEAGLLPAS